MGPRVCYSRHDRTVVCGVRPSTEVCNVSVQPDIPTRPNLSLPSRSSFPIRLITHALDLDFNLKGVQIQFEL